MQQDPNPVWPGVCPEYFLKGFNFFCLRVWEEHVMFLRRPAGNSLEARMNNEMNVQSAVSAPLFLCNYLCCGGLIIFTS